MFQLEQSHQHQLGEVLGQHADQGQLNNVQGATLKKEKHQVKVTENTCNNEQWWIAILF